MIRSWQRVVRLGVLLPPLLVLAVYSYWRFLTSDAFRVLAERVLSKALAAQVTIGSHELVSPSSLILRDLSAEFLAEGQPSGVSFRAGEARSRASWLLGAGPLEEIRLSDAEARLNEVGPALAKLDILSSAGRGSSVKRVVFEKMNFLLGIAGERYQISGTSWEVDLAGEKVRLSGSLGALHVEGVDLSELEAESPDVGFDVEVAGQHVLLKRLEVSGRTGWRIAGELDVTLEAQMPIISGEIHLWNLPVSRLYSPPEDVSIAPEARVRRTIRFSGRADNLAVSVDTEISGLSYADKSLDLEASRVKMDVGTQGRADVPALLRILFK